MIRHLGYMAATQSIDATTGRACRPFEATPDRIRSMIRDNLRDLARILNFNAEHGIAFYRVSSQVIPFGSRSENPVAWWDEFAADFDELGLFVRRHGLRLEMHPGQRCLLNSPSPETVALSILELGWHVHFFEALQLDPAHKLVVRVGGTFGDKVGSVDRFVTVVNGLPALWKRRLVVENDDHSYGVRDLLDVSRRTGLPALFGCHRRAILPEEKVRDLDLVARCFESWSAIDGPPIVHLTGLRPDPLRPGLLPDWVEPHDLGTLLALAPAATSFDCLLEARQGDRALFDLRERMAIRKLGNSTGL